MRKYSQATVGWWLWAAACSDDVPTSPETGTGGATGVVTTGGPDPETTVGSTGEPTGEPGSASTGTATTGDGETAATTGPDDTMTGGAYCGNGVFDPGEQCDDGNVSDLDTCLSTCMLPTCGDGIVSSGEACDDGNAKNNDTCTNACDLPVCGDAIAGPGEECDDGNDVDDDACSNACVLPTCGDGVVGPGELCDDGNVVDDDACSHACAPISCGDGLVQAGEACDDAGETALCNPNCTLAACGDGVVNATAGEACDDLGETAQCDADCTLVSCGDGAVNVTASEACDGGGQSATCDADCTPVTCGDGTINTSAGEFCDTLVELANCDVDCTIAECGDGVFNASAGEGCDEGGETVTCDSNCTVPFCGDGTLNMSVGENCDDGNIQNFDACPSTCVKLAPVGVAAGSTATCVLYAGGEMACWGADGENGTINVTGNDPNEMPPIPLNVGAKVLQISVGGVHTCVLVEGGFVRCWGAAPYGQLGYGNYEPFLPPSPNVNVGGKAVQVAAGGEHTCALLVGGTVRCWGRGGILGVGHPNPIGGPNNMPPPDVIGIGQATQIVTGYQHTCALLNDGTVRCWGFNTYGQLGLGNTDTIGDGPGEMPPPALSLGGAVVQLAGGTSFTCALTVAGSVVCWGANNGGYLGTGDTQNYGDNPGEMPPPVVNFGEGWATQVVSGSGHSCAILSTGGVKCWGAPTGNGYGGNNNVLSPAAQPKLNLGGEPKQLAAHLGSVCAFLVDDTLRCWGLNNFGQLGYGNQANQPTPKPNTPVPL